MYELEVTVRREGAKPYRQNDIRDAALAQNLVQLALASWGIPVPDSLGDLPGSTFADRLAATGEYRYDETELLIVIKRE